MEIVRLVVLLACTSGLRISEILGLRWTDFAFKRSLVVIQRSAVGTRLSKLKTESLQLGLGRIGFHTCRALTRLSGVSYYVD